MRIANRFFVAPVFLMVFLLTAYSVAIAGVEEDVAEIKRELQELKKDVGEIKNMLNAIISEARGPKRTTSSTTVDDDPMLGSPSAPLTMVDFSDYQCPFCFRFYSTTYPIIRENYINTGKLRYVFRDYPLPIHKQAPKAHEAANCAGEQGKYWDMHDRIFDNQQKMEVSDLKERAQAMGMEMTAFNACLDSGKYAEEIRKDIEDGNRAGVQGTPTFILGRTQQSGEVKGLLIRGAQPPAYFRTEIDSLLEQVTGQKGNR